MASACNTDGLDDFGHTAFREPLGVLLQALQAAPLNAMGIHIMRASVVHSLVNRLRMKFWRARHPQISAERIHAPLVVVGMMRSGTTLVQRLLAADARHTSTLGWEAMAPAPPPGTDPAGVGPRLEAALAREEQSKKFAPQLFAIHPTYAQHAEEEIMFLADAFLSHVPEASCDLPTYRHWLDCQDFTPAYDNLYQTLQLLQWQKRLRGEHCGRWVLKTPAHLGYLQNLLQTFPGAHVIHLHRDPVDTIPSGASLNTTLWRMHADNVDPAHVGAQWLARMTWANRRAMTFRSSMTDEKQYFTDIRFDAVMTDPLAQIARIYRAADITMTDDSQSAMRKWLSQDAEKQRDKHRYEPMDFGLTKTEIRAQFKDYYQRFLNTD